jgi:hypothetical protein
LVELETKIQDASQRHSEFLRELGLPPLSAGNLDRK